MTDEARVSWWTRLLGWLRGNSRKALPPAPETSRDDSGDDGDGRDGDGDGDGDGAGSRGPVHLRAEEETWLEALIAAVGEGTRGGDVASGAFWQRIDGLWARGHERLATEWMEKFASAPAVSAVAVVAIQARLVERYEQRRELVAALPHLEALTHHETHAARAYYLLAEHHRTRGDEAQALRHYEAVLARDMTYPNVRQRLERLRRQRGERAPAAMGETIAGLGTGADAGGASGSRYQLVRELGRGATGVVYLARDRELERDVAIKLLHPYLAARSSAAACARFFEEAKISASLRHPNIVAVLDMDERARRIVMELAAGGTLRRLLRERGPRPLRRALERHAQLLSALSAGHRRGIVHRDIKPGNLMFRREPSAPGVEIVLGDFGVAHLPGADGANRHDLARAGEAASASAEVVGTLAYMAPEQRRGRADPRADLYAAAVVLYEMLTGKTPWTRERLLSGNRTEQDMALSPAVTEGAPGDLADGLRAHLLALGAPDPERRPDTATALAQARTLRDIAIATASDAA